MKIRSLLIICCILIILSCSSQLYLKPETLQEQQTVTIYLKNGNKVQGEILKIDQDAFIIVDRVGQAWRAPLSRIDYTKGPFPVRDANGAIISEREISARKSDNNLWIFAFSGALLSMGTSFFISSMIARATDEENNKRENIIYGGTAAGTAAGALIFSQIGKRKDRHQAIEMIRKERAFDPGMTIEEDKKRKEQILEEIEALKRERNFQEQEIEKLKTQIKDKK